MYETRDLMMILGTMWLEMSLLHRTPRFCRLLDDHFERKQWQLSLHLFNIYHINQCRTRLHQQMQLIGCLRPWTKTLPHVVYFVCISPKDVALKGISFPNRLEFKKLKGSIIKWINRTDKVPHFPPHHKQGDRSQTCLIWENHLSTWKRWGSDHSKLNGRIIYVKCFSTFFTT